MNFCRGPLSTPTYFYEMLKDNPQFTAIYPGIEDELLVGAIDQHIHAYADFVHRSQDMLQIAVDAFAEYAAAGATRCVVAYVPVGDELRGELRTLLDSAVSHHLVGGGAA